MSKKSFLIINILLSAAVVVAGIDTFRRIGGGTTTVPSLPMTPPHPMAAAPSESEYRPIRHYDAIVQRNLFRTRDTAATDIRAAESAIDIDSLKETELKLRLLGTVTARDKDAVAVIEDMKTKDQSLYRVGDKIQDATIKRIFRENIVLSLNGEDSVLKMEREGLPGDFEDMPETLLAMHSSEPKPVQQKRVLSKALIDNALSDSADLMNQFNLKPYEGDGEAEGVVISDIKRSSIVMRMGLRNGDIISAVNGTVLDSSPESSLALMNSLADASTFSIDLVRRGKPLTIEYTIK